MRHPGRFVAAIACAVLAGRRADVVLAAAPCGVDCLRATRGELRECVAQATVVFALEKNRCLDRSPVCVEACLFRHDDCVTATGDGPAIDACAAQLETALGSCSTKYAAGSTKRADCNDAAQLAAYQCRTRARKAARPALRRCRDEHGRCLDRCGPGEPPLGARACRLGASERWEAARSACKASAALTQSACLEKDGTCYQQCRDDRGACTAPVESALEAATAQCDAQAAADVATCIAANPTDEAARDACVETAQSDGFLCRDAAREAAAPGLAACGGPFARCVRSCPPPPSPTASRGARRSAGGSIACAGARARSGSAR